MLNNDLTGRLDPGQAKNVQVADVVGRRVGERTVSVVTANVPSPLLYIEVQTGLRYYTARLLDHRTRFPIPE